MTVGGHTDWVAVTHRYLRRNREAGDHCAQVGSDEYLVSQGVFSPEIFEDAVFFAEALRPLVAGNRFLEIGSGTGLIAVEAARAGALRVLAIDLNGAAVENTRSNAARHGVADLVEVRAGDMFDPLHSEERFDVIFWNPPFIDAERDDSDPLEWAVFDPGYVAIGRYLKIGARHLAFGGSLLIGFSSTSGDRDQLDKVAKRAALRLRLLESGKLADENDDEFSLELYEAVA